MTAPFLNSIDWNRPWLAPLRPIAEPLLQVDEWRQALNDAATAQLLHNHRGLPIHFVSQADLPNATAYETFISETGCVPTRDNLHDFFNALIWLAFPRTKAQLNALQATEIAKAAAAAGTVPGPHSRGGTRDAATIFDENAALLVIRDMELLDALRGHRWEEAFVTRRAAFDVDCEVWLFGHALIEKLVVPYKAITAHAWIVNEPEFFTLPPLHQRDWMDATVAHRLADGGLITTDLMPLPVLGVPGWWESQTLEFYRDARVFRPKRNVNR